MALLVAGALAAAGCPFEPRDAPVPCDPGTDPTCRTPAEFREPLTPEEVRDNIERALEKPTVDPNYFDSLAESFRYIPDQQASTVVPCPDFFAAWDKEREVRFMRTALETGTAETRPTRIDVRFTRYVDTGELNDPDQRRYNVDYEVVLTFQDAGQTPPTRTERYGATAVWDLVGGNLNFWTLKRWEDTRPRDGTEGSLGILRVRRGECQ